MTNSACALAKAAARLAIDGLDLCTAAPRAQKIKAHDARLRALSPDAVPNRLLGVLCHQTLQFRLGLYMLEVGRSDPRKHRANSAQALEELMSTMRIASILDLGGSTLKRRGAHRSRHSARTSARQ